MKKVITYKSGNKIIEKTTDYIPFRYIWAILISIAETAAIIGIVIALTYLVPYFFVVVILTQVGCVLNVIARDDNPDYKVPWLLFIICVPVIGFMMYFMFYSRKLKRKYIKRLKELASCRYKKDDTTALNELKNTSIYAYNQVNMLLKTSGTHVFTDTSVTYYNSGEKMQKAMLEALKSAKNYIFLEYFIIDEGIFWRSILDILLDKVKQGVEVKLIYDDVGCMKTLPGNYYKKLNKLGISATMFSRLKGQADNEFNNRNHRKILIIDGVVGFTGGINIADEYINEKERFGHWKDVGVKLCGSAVMELTQIFLTDFGISQKEKPNFDKYFKLALAANFNNMPVTRSQGVAEVDSLTDKLPNANNGACEQKDYQINNGFVVPFGDGPKPIYPTRVAKNIIINMLGTAKKYAYFTTPYLIIDNEMCSALENAALRGIDVKIIVPHIPDKKIIFAMTKSYYPRLINAGVKIYEYLPGFIHAKTMVVDGETAIVGTINLDYRSLVHHFENGVYMHRCPCIQDISADIQNTLSCSKQIESTDLKNRPLRRFFNSVLRILAPLM